MITTNQQLSKELVITESEVLQAEPIQQPVATEWGSLLSLPSLLLQEPTSVVPTLVLIRPRSEMEQKNKKTNLLPTDCCHRNCWCLWYVAFHGHSNLPRNLCGSRKSRGRSRSNGPAGHGGLQGRLQEIQRQKHWLFQMRAQCWSRYHYWGSKPGEKVSFAQV